MAGDDTSKPINQDGKQETRSTESLVKRELHMDKEVNQNDQSKSKAEKTPKAAKSLDTKKASATKKANAKSNTGSDIGAVAAETDKSAKRGDKSKGVAEKRKARAPKAEADPPKKTNRELALEQAQARARGEDLVAVANLSSAAKGKPSAEPKQAKESAPVKANQGAKAKKSTTPKQVKEVEPVSKGSVKPVQDKAVKAAKKRTESKSNQSTAAAKPVGDKSAKAEKTTKEAKRPKAAKEAKEAKEAKAKAEKEPKEAKGKKPKEARDKKAKKEDPGGQLGANMSSEELKAALHAVIDELFNFESLSKNVFLLSKMNQYMYIPVRAVQKHFKIRALTTNYAALISALKTSRAIIVSSDGKQVRPNLATQRTVLILRNVPDGTNAEEITKELFGDAKCQPAKVRCEVADNWFLHFDSAEDTLTAYEHVKNKKFKTAPVSVRVKSVNMPVLFNRSAFRTNLVPPNPKLGAIRQHKPSSTPLNPNAKEFELGKAYEVTPSSRTDIGGRGGEKGGKGRGRGESNRGSRERAAGRGGAKQQRGTAQTVDLPANQFMHVKETISGNIRCEIGPKNLHMTANEMIARPPQALIDIPPDHFCVVRNPVRKDAFGNVLMGEKDKPKLRYGDKDVRLHSYGSFALYPGEQLVEPVQRMQQVPEGQALQLRALRAFLDKSAHLANPMWRVSGDTWLFMGPAQYLPHAEAEVVGLVTPIVIAPNTALEVTATNDFIDSKSGKLRSKGDVWLVRQAGPFLAGIDEEVLRFRTGHEVSITEALHLRAESALSDAFGIQRNAGDEYLVTTRNKIVYIPELNETVVGSVHPTHVSSTQYCVLEEIVKEEDAIVRHRKVVQGDKKFFLQPNQRLIQKPTPKLNIAAGEALLLKVIEPFTDQDTVSQHSPVYMSAHLAVVFALVAYLVTQPSTSMLSSSSIVLALGTLLLTISLFIPRSSIQEVERLAGQEYLVHGPLDNYVPSAQVEQLGRKRAVLHIPALGLQSLYWASSD